MFTVTRAPLNTEEWTSPGRSRYNKTAMDHSRRTALSTREDNHLGTSSLATSDLFPELLSWSAFHNSTIRSHTASTFLQAMPNDITEEDYFEDETMAEWCRPLSLSRIFDPTTLAIGFDISHLYGLDDQLIYSPKDAFADVCWMYGVSRRSSEGVLDSEMMRAPKSPTRSSSCSGESDSGPDECRTDEAVGKHHDVPLPTVEPTTYMSEKTPSKENIRDYIPSFDYHYNPNQHDSVGAFPIPSVTKQSKLSRGFSAFRSPWNFGRP